jgi:hypothetical protein
MFSDDSWLENEHAWTVNDIGANSISSVIYLDQINVAFQAQSIPKIKSTAHDSFLAILKQAKYSLESFGSDNLDLYREDRELGDLKDVLMEITNERTLNKRLELFTETGENLELLSIFMDNNFDLKSPAVFEKILNSMQNEYKTNKQSQSAESLNSSLGNLTRNLSGAPQLKQSHSPVSAGNSTQSTVAQSATTTSSYLKQMQSQISASTVGTHSSSPKQTIGSTTPASLAKQGSINANVKQDPGPVSTNSTASQAKQATGSGSTNASSPAKQIQSPISPNGKTTAIASKEYYDLMKMYSALQNATTAKVYKKILKDKQDLFKSCLMKLQNLESEINQLLVIFRELKDSLNNIKEFNVIQGVRVLDLKQRRGDFVMALKVSQSLDRLSVLEKKMGELLGCKDYASVLDVFEEAFCIFFREFDKEVPWLPRSNSIEDKSSGDIDKSSKETIEEVTSGVSLITNPQNKKYASVQGVDCIEEQLNRFITISKSVLFQITADFTNVLKNDLTKVLSNIKHTTPTIEKQKDETMLKSVIRKIYNGDHILLAKIQQQSTILTPIEINLADNESFLKQNLKPFVFGLLRMDKLNEALDIFKENCFVEIKNRLIKSLEKSGAFKVKTDKFQLDDYGVEFKSLSFDSFFKILSDVYVGFLEIVGQVSIYNQILMEIIQEADENLKIGLFDIDRVELSTKPDPSKPTRISSNEGMKTLKEYSVESKNCLYQIIDYTHLLSSKILSSRSQQNTKLNPKDFYKIFTTTYEFQTTGERLIGRLLFNIKGVLLTQGKSWIVYFHEEKSKQLSGLLENEQWIQTEIAIDFQNLIERLKTELQRTESVKDIRDEVGIDVDVEDLAEESGADTDDPGSPNRLKQVQKKSVTQEESTAKYLALDGVKFYAVISVLLFVKMLTEYVELSKNVSVLTPEILNRVYELLKVNFVNLAF